MGNTAILSALLILALVGMGTGCSKGSQAGDTISAAVSMPTTGNFRLSLTDAPHPSLSHVIVNVDHVELLLAKGNDQGRLIVGQNLGPIDLLKLRDGVHLPIKDLNLKSGVEIKQFRLILKSEGNYIERIKDNSLCYLKTPSEQQTGLKLIMPGGGFEIEDNQVYSLIVDFDVDHSIVDNKNNCLLKPVLKVKSLTKVPSDSGDDGGPSSGGDSSGGGSSTGGDTSSGDGSSVGSGDTSSGGTTGGDTSSGGTTSGDTSSGGTTGGDTSSGGTTSGDTSSGGTTDSGSGTASGSTGDGAPIVTEGNTIFFNN